MLPIKMEYSRYILKVQVLGSKGNTEVLCLVDTGAVYTYMPIQLLRFLSDTDLVKSNVVRGGVVPDAHRVLSEYKVSLVINNGILNNVSVLIPNDDRPCKPLLGINVLSRLDMMQLGNSYQLVLRKPSIPGTEFDTVNKSNLAICLDSILKSLRRSDLYKELLPLFPASIEMPYEEFYDLVVRIIRQYHIKN